jgi:hypothetical protein
LDLGDKILLNKFVALVGSGRQTCRPSRDKKGLKDWANETLFIIQQICTYHIFFDNKTEELWPQLWDEILNGIH